MWRLIEYIREMYLELEEEVREYLLRIYWYLTLLFVFVFGIILLHLNTDWMETGVLSALPVIINILMVVGVDINVIALKDVIEKSPDMKKPLEELVQDGDSVLILSIVCTFMFFLILLSSSLLSEGYEVNIRFLMITIVFWFYMADKENEEEFVVLHLVLFYWILFMACVCTLKYAQNIKDLRRTEGEEFPGTHAHLSNLFFLVIVVFRVTHALFTYNERLNRRKMLKLLLNEQN